MLRSQDRSYTRADTWLLLGCLVFGGIALFLPARWGYDLAGALRGSVLSPLVWLQERAEEGRTSRSRFRAVTAQRDSVALAAQTLPILRAENSRLRQLLGLAGRLHTPYVAAEVLHQPTATDGRVLLLNVGQRDGVRVFDPVVAPEGLIGLVTEVTPRTAVAMTWANPEFRISAYTADGGAFGIIAPGSAATASETELELRGVPYRDSIPSGTVVLSSGLGGVYPKGIPVGTIVGITSEQRGWERVYRLRPAANPSAAAHVLVLTSPRDTAVVAAFPSDSILRAVAADSARRQAQADSVLRARLADSILAALRDSTARAAAATAAGNTTSAGSTAAAGRPTPGGNAAVGRPAPAPAPTSPPATSRPPAAQAPRPAAPAHRDSATVARPAAPRPAPSQPAAPSGARALEPGATIGAPPAQMRSDTVVRRVRRDTARTGRRDTIPGTPR
ncbi:MAG TPA: rod shape-determining protein MreC [Gemmatimonadales bacterium]|nr:rod shape-determining protein MreC [Gemmatimonadales bacterium]